MTYEQHNLTYPERVNTSRFDDVFTDDGHWFLSVVPHGEWHLFQAALPDHSRWVSITCTDRNGMRDTVVVISDKRSRGFRSSALSAGTAQRQARLWLGCRAPVEVLTCPEWSHLVQVAVAQPQREQRACETQGEGQKGGPSAR